MNPMIIETAGAVLVAEGSSKGWMRKRWTEIRCWHFPHGIQNGGKCWLVEVAALSREPGERKKTSRMASASLERALSIVDESDMGMIVRETAKEYAEDHGIPLRMPGKQLVPEGLHNGLAWLCGVPAEQLDTIALQDKMGIGIRVGHGPLQPVFDALLPFVDRRAFQAAMKREKARG